MNPEDKNVTLADLNRSILGIKELIEDRTALLQSMFKEDLYNDFLMQEARQSGAVGVTGMDPTGDGVIDLSLILI